MKNHRAHISMNAEAALTVSIIVALSATFFLLANAYQTALAQGSGSIQVSISSTLPAITGQNASYSLEGAQFGIYSDEACTQLEASVQTDTLGHAASEPLSPGTYYIRQTLSSAGFFTSEETLSVTVEEGGRAGAHYALEPIYAQTDLLIFETNAETGTQSPVAGSTLTNARFTISYFDKATDSATLNGAMRSWTFESDEAGEVHLRDEYRRAGAPLFTNANSVPVLPCGRYIVTIDTLPHGYLCETSPIQFDISTDASTIEHGSVEFEPIEAKMQIARGDVLFHKVDDSQNAMARIPFLLSYANGEDDSARESHVVMTDAEGNFTSESSRIAHSQNTNANDAAVTINPDGSFTVDEDKLTEESGVWFSSDRAGNSVTPNDSRCALPFGSYSLQELPCSANADKNLVNVEFSIYANGFPVKLDTIVNTTPGLSGSVSDRHDGDRLLRPNPDATVIDTVSYRNLVPGQAYTLHTFITCKDTGEHVASTGSDELVMETPVNPEQSDGSLQVELAFDASELAGRELIVHEELRSNTGMVIGTPEENDVERTVKVEPRIIASAFDTADQDRYVMGTSASITGRVRYEGLRLGVPYTLSSTLVDRATGNAVRNAQGDVISTSIEHVPSSYTDSVDIELPVDVTPLVGHDLVVFTNIQNDDDQMVASLQDMDDAELTLKTVKLTTNACDNLDKDKIFDGSADSVTIIDTVKYANLEPGREYTLSGVLMDKETGKELIVNGKKVASNKQFTAAEISGSVDMEFSFDASAQTSEVLVVFEKLSCDENVVAEHVDIDDVAQTVTSADIDPEQAVPTVVSTNGSDSGTTAIAKAVPKTSDMFSRASAVAAMLAIAACLCIAYAAHRRSKTIETMRNGN